MRDAVAEYVRAAHDAYVRAALLQSPAVQGRLPLLSGETLTIAAIGTHYLHLVATREALGAGPRGEIAFVDGATGPISWRLHFFDPVVVPALGLTDEAEGPAFAAAREAIGIRTYLYHLTLKPPTDLDPHHAGHTGAGLAGAHVAEARDFEAIRRAVGPDLAPLAAEFEGAAIAHLDRASGLIARTLAPGDAGVDEAAGDPRTGPSDREALRRTVLHAVRTVPVNAANGTRR
ncbi:MAG: hypothetical protein WEE66_10670 [Actinomycetota bacterium]